MSLAGRAPPSLPCVELGVTAHMQRCLSVAAASSVPGSVLRPLRVSQASLQFGSAPGLQGAEPPSLPGSRTCHGPPVSVLRPGPGLRHMFSGMLFRVTGHRGWEVGWGAHRPGLCRPHA